MLVEHRVDDVDKGLVAVEQTMPAGEEVAFKPALAQMLAEDLHYAAVSREMDVVGFDRFHPDPVGRFEHVIQPVRRCLVWTHQTEYPGFRIEADQVSQITTHDARGFRR